LGGIPDFSALKIGPVAIGRFINAVLNFLIVGTAIYFMVVIPMNKKEGEKITLTYPKVFPLSASLCPTLWRKSLC
jgi:large-conductance mechanosensitive channel